MDIRVLELVGGDFSGESTGSLGEAVLGRDLDWLLESFLNLEEVQSWGGDDDLCERVSNVAGSELVVGPETWILNHVS